MSKKTLLKNLSLPQSLETFLPVNREKHQWNCTDTIIVCRNEKLYNLEAHSKNFESFLT